MQKFLLSSLLLFTLNLYLNGVFFQGPTGPAGPAGFPGGPGAKVISILLIFEY